MNFRIIGLIAICLLFVPGQLGAQDKAVSPSVIITGKFLGESPPLRDLPTITDADWQQMVNDAEEEERNPELESTRSYPFANNALPKGPDPVWQRNMGADRDTRAPLLNFNGFDCPGYPPDPNGTMGQEYYMQTINFVYSIYNRAGNVVAGPGNLNTLFAGVPGSNTNSGDPIVLYDEQADRYLVAEFCLPIDNSTDLMLIAVSTTNDPTGTWYRYSFDVDDVPDYPKFGIWRDGYYMGTNNSGTKDIYVFERSQMLTGGTARYIGFNNQWRPNVSFMCVPPLDNDGAFATAGKPGLFISFKDDATGGGGDSLLIYELAVNWSTPSNSTFNQVQKLSVAPFDSNFGTDQQNIPQLGTTVKLDAIPMVMMNPPQYRNFGTYETIVCCHTVDVDNTNHAGIRWYELRRVSSGNWTIRQQGTYAPDGNSRWMGSIMLNGHNEIALGYSVSGSSIYPGIRYCGQTSSAYAAASGVLDVAEGTILSGSYSQTGHFRWGDYSSLQVDPSDDETFWYTSQYVGVNDARKTKIANFQIGPLQLTSNFFASNTNPQINTTVNFTDVSFGGATSWSWSITPGTFSYVGGTSSTTQNPQVQFTTAGNYSITLTVSDGSTYNSKTKTNYINAIVCNALLLPITEDFSDGVMPGCWIIKDNQGNGQIWRFNNPGARTINTTTGSNGFAILDSYMYGAGNTQNTDLITPVLNFSANSDVNILFQHYFKNASGSTGTLSYSIDGGSTWNVIQTWTDETGNPSYFNRDVSAQVAHQANVRFKWNYTGTFGNYWAIDDLSFTDVHTVLWTGGYSTHNWSDGGNWDSGVPPTSTTMVAIPASVPLWPEINGNFTLGINCKNLTLMGAAQMSVSGNFTILVDKTLEFSGNGQLNVGGNWTNNGTFLPGTGTVKFTGSTAATLTGYTTTTTMTNYTRTTFPKSLTALHDSIIGPTGNNLGINVPLGFNFNYIGINYTQTRICTNGWISMNLTGVSSASNANLFTAGTDPYTTIAPWWDDLSDDATSVVSYNTQGTVPFRIFTAEWDSVLTYSTGATARITFQVKLFETTNVIEFYYGPMDGGSHNTASETASIGIEDATGGIGHFIDGFTGSYTSGNYKHKSLTAWDSLYNYRFSPPTITQTFANVIVDRSGDSLKFNSNVVITGNLIINNGIVVGQGSASGTLNVGGDWTNNGTFVPGSGTVSLIGTVNQNVGGTSSTTFKNLTLNNSTGITLLNNEKVSGTLTMTAGNVNGGSYILELGTSTPALGVLSWTSGNIIGNFKRWIAASTATAIDFPVGTASVNYNARITFKNNTGGSLTAKFESGDPGNNTGFPIIDNSLTFYPYDLYTEGTWTLVPTTLTSSKYSLELTGTGFTSAGLADGSIRIFKRTDGSNWTHDGRHVTGVPPIAKRDSLNGFSRFALAYICGTHATVTPGGPDTVCQSASPIPLTLAGAAFGGSASNAAWSITSLNPSNGGINGSLSSTAYTTTPASVTYTPPASYAGNVTLTLASNDPAGSCTAASATRTVVIRSRAKILGNFMYYNLANTPLTSGITVKLYQVGSQVGSDYNVTSGTYQFTDLCPGTYEIRVSSSNSTDGSINTTDAAQTNFWGANPYQIEKVRFYAGDVTGVPFYINSSDAQRIQANFVYGTAFDKGPWAFWRAGETISSNSNPSQSYANVTISGSDVTANIYGLCAGDFNRSFTPGAMRLAGTKTELIYKGNRQISSNQEFELPVRMVNPSGVGSVSLILNFPEKLVEVKDVSIDGSDDQPDWAVHNDELRIGWFSTVPLNLAADADLLTLRLKTTTAFTGVKSIKFALAPDPLNELADDRYDVIPGAVISVEVIEASTDGTLEEPSAPCALSLSAYPNPFSDFTMINYTLPFEGKVNLEIRSILGKPLTTLVDGTQAAGDHKVKFDTHGIPAGVYTATVTLTAGKEEIFRTIKLINAR